MTQVERGYEMKIEKGILYGWHDLEEDRFDHIYPRRFHVEMCSPDGFKEATEKGKGKLVKLKVVEAS